MAKNASTFEELTRAARALDGKGYGAYKSLTGTYKEGDVQVIVDRVQADPYAAPSKVRIVVDRSALQVDTPNRTDRIAAADVLARRVSATTKNNRDISIGVIGQEVLERTNVEVFEDRVEFRLLVGLPAKGRRILGYKAADTLGEALQAAKNALKAPNNTFRNAIELLRDQEALREQLAARNLVAFIGDGANLPRRSGDSDLPLEGGTPFTSPEELQTTFDLPSGRTVTGMGIREGVTVIVGGGYHGKSTLLRAIERGVYPHIEGDGREWAITRADAVSVRAEDGRPVTSQDISAFISDLPSGADTTRFSTTNASGSTSQAANVVEAIQSGASTLLIDEDTSATNFMIRDDLMSSLIPHEPITPFSARVRPLYEQLGVSTVLVAGGSAAFLALADTVIAMDSYLPADVTTRAHELAEAPTQLPLTSTSFARDSRNLDTGGLVVEVRGRRKAPKARGSDTISVGRSDIDLSALSQLAGAAQVSAIAAALERFDEELFSLLDAHGPSALTTHPHPGHLTRPRRYEILAALNRFRNLRSN